MTDMGCNPVQSLRMCQLDCPVCLVDAVNWDIGLFRTEEGSAPHRGDAATDMPLSHTSSRLTRAAPPGGPPLSPGTRLRCWRPPWRPPRSRPRCAALNHSRRSYESQVVNHQSISQFISQSTNQSAAQPTNRPAIDRALDVGTGRRRVSSWTNAPPRRCAVHAPLAVHAPRLPCGCAPVRLRTHAARSHPCPSPSPPAPPTPTPTPASCGATQ